MTAVSVALLRCASKAVHGRYVTISSVGRRNILSIMVFILMSVAEAVYQRLVPK